MEKEPGASILGTTTRIREVTCSKHSRLSPFLRNPVAVPRARLSHEVLCFLVLPKILCILPQVG